MATSRTSTEKVDLYKLHKADYAAPKAKPVIIEIGKAKYLTIEGSGPPGEETFQAKIGGLFTAAYTMKFMSKAAGQDYVVCKLEGQFTCCGAKPTDESPSHSTAEMDWKLMIRVPDFITKKTLTAAQATVREKGGAPEADEVHLEAIRPGKCIQMLHVGPYDQAEETARRMEDFAAECGLRMVDPHHQIYLSDPCRVAPEKLKTILRHPVKKA